MTTTLIGLSTAGKIAFFSSRVYAGTPDYTIDYKLDKDLEDYPLVVDLEQAGQKESVENSAVPASISAPDGIAAIEFSQSPADRTTSVHTLESPDPLAPSGLEGAYPFAPELISPIEFSQSPADQTTSVHVLESPDPLTPSCFEGAYPFAAGSSESTPERRLIQERVQSLESRIADLEAQQSSPTMKLSGEAVLGMSQALGRDIDESAVLQRSVELIFSASFIGEDRLEVGLESGNLVEFSFTDEVTLEGRLGFLEGTSGNRVELSELSYEFPIGDRASVYVSTTGDDLSDFNPFLGDSSSGAISEFGAENPIHSLVEDVGVQLNYELTEDLNIGLGYFSEQASNPISGAGLFNGNHSAFVQLEFEPSDSLLLGFSYIHTYNDSSLETGTGSLRSQVDLGRPVVGNSFGMSTSWSPDSKISIGGWVGFTNATVIDLGDAEVWNYALTLALPDLGRAGNLLGLIIGQEPKLTETTGFTIDGRSRDPDTSFHIEAFYRHQLNDHVSITPGVVWITAPDHDQDNADIAVFTVRTVFTF